MKVIKKILKGILIFIGSIFAFLALCCVVTLCWSGVQRAKGDVFNTLPETPADFVPSVRVVIFTDTHKENERTARAITRSYELFDNDETYAGVDGIFCLGDFSSIGYPDDYEAYIAATDEVVRAETPFVTLLGNHEMKRKDNVEIFRDQFGYEPNAVYEINGFSFIAFSGERSLTEWTMTPSSLKWAADRLKEAEAKAGDKPVFVLQHPHNFGTVYGSTIWCTPQTNVLWNGHNKVVNFSGHSHFPMNDPRSINQTTYTSVGVGGMARFELDRNYIVGQHPDGYDTAFQFAVVEADLDGSVRIREYDMNSGTFFNDYYIENVNDPSTYAYTFKNLKAHDSTPVFPQGVSASASRNDDGEWVLSFDDAKCNYIVHDYTITIKDASGSKVLKKTFVDNYYVIDGDDHAHFRIGKDTLSEGGSYTAEIVAQSAYHFKSDKITLPFTAE